MQASEEFQKASDEGETEKAYKFKVRTVSITRKMKQDAFDMLTLLGVPTLRVFNFSFEQNYIDMVGSRGGRGAMCLSYTFEF